ncbi:PREDICTED: serine protease easter-like [Nicrophorus vespilloides]|uniref:CLIP domain-containing serine protease n=1 Tax=Nicrophorus vespilloides TaxID=110193 RepID=A0ABM1NFX5_NICVS|nr:PREDICTED: serine protease easter-like [Nicrophorus vespilloides]
MRLITCIFALYFVSSAFAQESCKTPNGETAKCVSIFACPILYESGRSGGPEAYRFLQQSVCKKSFYNIYVCCGSDTIFKPQEIVSKTPDMLADAPRNNYIAKRSECGYMNPDFRIYGGNKTGLDEFPWMALLEYQSLKDGERSFRCGGSIIGRRHILTAAHCVTGVASRYYRLVNIRLGEWNTSSTSDCVNIGKKKECSDPVLNMGFERITPFAGYEDGSRYNDIALIRLDRDIKYSKFVSPICLPMEEKQVVKPNAKMIVAGWGQTENGTNSEVKLRVQVPIVNYRDCARKFGRSLKVTDNQICAGGQKNKDSCTGDSGGPLMLRNSETDQWLTEGIVSLGKGCGEEGWPAVYTKVRPFVKWIKKHAY